MNNLSSIASEALVKGITSAINSSVRQIVEEEARAAAKRTEERVRAKAAQIAADVVSNLDFQSFTDRLVITLKIDSNREEK